MKFELTVLGCSSAVPTSERFPTAHLLNSNGRFFLFDCGEGTQIQLRKYHIKFQRIEAIFISHLHGDHYFGLIGVLSSMSLLGRTNELTIIAPKEIKEILEVQKRASQMYFSFHIDFLELNEKEELVYQNEWITVDSINLNHRIFCKGFLVKEKPKLRTLIAEKLDFYNIPNYFRKSLKEGSDYTPEAGEVIPNNQLTLDPPRSRSFAFCTDTAFDLKLVDKIQNVDLLYHEATFSAELFDKAKKTGHSTSVQAAEIAKLAQVKKLMIGHYSARYKNPDQLLNECKVVFPNTIAANEGLVVSIDK